MGKGRFSERQWKNWHLSCDRLAKKDVLEDYLSPTFVNSGRHPRVPEITIVPAIEVTVLRFAGTENDRRFAAAMVGLPLAAAGIGPAPVPNQLFATTFAGVSRSLECPLYLVLCKLIVISH